MGKSILVVDDSASVRQVVGIALKGAGYDVVEASDGVDGLEKLDGRRLHLIISDVNMPRMDGITFITRARQVPGYGFTPIMMLTTESDDAKKKQGQAAGAKAWVVKPFKPEQMLQAVEKLISP
jgi:two-component system chemotaxis response regulator CheY